MTKVNEHLTRLDKGDKTLQNDSNNAKRNITSLQSDVKTAKADFRMSKTNEKIR